MLRMRKILGLFFSFICVGFCYLGQKRLVHFNTLGKVWITLCGNQLLPPKPLQTARNYGASQCSKIISEDPIFCCLLQHVWLGSVSRESQHLTDVCARAVFPSHMIMKCDPAWPMWCWGYLRRSLGHPAFNRTEKTEVWNKRLFSKRKPGWWQSQITNPRFKRLTTDQPRIWTISMVRETKVSPGAVGVLLSPTCCSNTDEAYF